MRANLVRIGNSRGIRIPKAFLEECRLSDVVDIRRVGNRIEVRPVKQTRQGWSEAFRAMAEHADDALLDRGQTRATNWEKEEWRW
ncbi:MAG: AbrB/MazE/SpoVT family DNA-binding domain-containing protein [Deltaproteobacteria bacterium]|nr:AbrB/MazE/SpoVT family DNA-binding domain-containing protein [Deltaproteobacteria bacterium]